MLAIRTKWQNNLEVVAMKPCVEVHDGACMSCAVCRWQFVAEGLLVGNCSECLDTQFGRCTGDVDGMWWAAAVIFAFFWVLCVSLVFGFLVDDVLLCLSLCIPLSASLSHSSSFFLSSFVWLSFIWVLSNYCLALHLYTYSISALPSFPICKPVFRPLLLWIYLYVLICYLLPCYIYNK